MIEDWFYEGKILRGGKLWGFEKPNKELIDDYRKLSKMYLLCDERGDCIVPGIQHYSLINLEKTPTELKRE